MEWPIITKDTSLEQLKLIHQAIWQYVIETGDKPLTPYRNNCVGCEYVFEVLPTVEGKTRERCCVNVCPIAWSKPGCCSGCGKEYDDWFEHGYDSLKNVKKYAKIIRDIPFKFELGGE